MTICSPMVPAAKSDALIKTARKNLSSAAKGEIVSPLLKAAPAHSIHWV